MSTQPASPVVVPTRKKRDTATVSAKHWRKRHTAPTRSCAPLARMRLHALSLDRGLTPSGRNRSAIAPRLTPSARNRRAIARESCKTLSFAGLVALARSPNPIPSRTRPLNSSAPMVLCLKTWESRSLPGLQRTDQNLFTSNTKNAAPAHKPERRFCVRITMGRRKNIPLHLASARSAS